MWSGKPWVLPAAGWLLAALSLAAIGYVFVADPVRFVRMVAEDHFGEYFTAVGFVIAGVLTLGSGFAGRGWVYRLISVVMGLVMVAVGMEEISWGQRIFGFHTPEALSQMNVQSELTLHNVLTPVLLRVASIAVVSGWAVVSLAVWLRPRWAERFDGWGLPRCNLAAALALAVAWAILVIQPTVKSAEIAELFLGMTVLLWAVPRAAGRWFGPDPRQLKALGLAAASVGLTVVLAMGLEIKRPGWLGRSMNFMAETDYPNAGMPNQALVLFEYMESRPKLCKPHTSLEYAELLTKMGHDDRARVVLEHAAERYHTTVEEHGLDIESARLLAEVHLYLNEPEISHEYSSFAIGLDTAELQRAATDLVRAEIMMSIAHTHRVVGDTDEALGWARRAEQLTVPWATQYAISKWIRETQAQ